MADPTTKTTTKKGQPSALKTGYLILYNFFSAIGWLTVLGRVVMVTYIKGYSWVPIVAADWTKWTQTMAGMEVLHAAFGLVRSPVLTTLIQVFSRYLLVWGVVHPFPQLALSTPAYTSMLLAWSMTEVIRYSYFVLTLSGSQPKLLSWLRYNTFFLLYPIGITSECWMMYLAATGPGAVRTNVLGGWYARGLLAILAAYVPGSYIMYSHMMAQRRKVMRTAAKDKST